MTSDIFPPIQEAIALEYKRGPNRSNLKEQRAKEYEETLQYLEQQIQFKKEQKIMEKQKRIQEELDEEKRVK